MYINKIDDLIDKVLNEFFVTIIQKDKILVKIYKETNFVKFQKEINSILISFCETINLSEVRELVKSSDAVNTISEALKRYIAFYMFLTIGFNYTSKDDTFINNVVEFTKNQPEYGYKIDNFFNSDSNSLLIKYNNMVKNILTLLDADQNKIDILKVKPDYKEAILFLNQLGADYIEKYFKLENLEKNKQTQAHNIIKTIIVLLLYKVTEKKDFFRLLEMTEHMDGEYMFIDIVIPKQKYVDYNSVERLLGSDPLIKNLSYYFWKFLEEHENDITKPPTSIEEKIILLIQSGILYPVCDDFLLYHKDSERYDRSTDPGKIKKKEDTKIRYIVNKIESTSEYYSEQIKKDDKIKNNIKKNFHIPLLYRKAITVNHNEDINIINKFINQGKRSVENNEYFNDLVGYKVYPYINFKEFDKSGFNITLSKTIDVVRYVSLAKDGDFKQGKNNILQTRVATKDNSINIVGFMIPTNLRPLQCLKSKDIIDIRTLSKNNKNGFDLIIKYLRESTLGIESHSSSVYWIFDMDKDIVTSGISEYDQSVRTSVQEQVKHIVSALYDGIVNELYYIILDKMEKHKHLNVQIANKIIKFYEKKSLKFPQKQELENKIYELIEKIEPEYDKNEDIVHGISDNVIVLPEYKPSKPAFQLLKVNLSDIGEYGEIEEKDIVDGICQHNISWERIAGLQKSNPKIYVDELYNFIQQYVFENVDGEYVCKSCGFQLNIKKYIIDGVFDDESQKFITYSMPMNIPLEDIPEYEKYKITIRNIDKFIEKVAIVSNILHLTKSSPNVKERRKAIVKDTIDILLLNNKKLKNNLRERNEMASKLYGVNRDLSNLFVFDLDNSIFVFSSKDKDHYKPIKQNNIVSYLIFLMLLEINDSHVPYLGGDKKGLCNFQVFDKIFHSLFGGLKIRINNKGDMANITNYKILCYMIYIIGCSTIKYNMWFYDYPDPTKKKKYEPIIQKIFVHTVIDILNSVLESTSTPGAHRLYEVISIKMFKKLASTFNNEELYNRMKDEGKISIVGEKKDFIITKKNYKDLSGKFTPMNYDPPFRFVCRMPRFYAKKKVLPYFKYYKMNNLTNCPSGEFHEWAISNGKFVCKICKADLTTLNFNEDINIINNFKFVRLQNLAKKYCFVDGLSHQFAIDDKGINKCTKANHDEKHNYTKEELIKLQQALDNVRRDQADLIIEKNKNINNDINKDISYIDKVVDHVKKGYKDGFPFIDELLDELHSVIGSETGTKTDIYLKENSYVINHDHLGNLLEKQVVLTDANNKIFYKQNHPFFNTDVIYYSSYKGGKIEVFYDATTKILLGYKEESKNFVAKKNEDRRLIVNYSISNKLKLLGYSSQFIDVSEQYKTLLIGTEGIGINKDIIVKTITMNIIRNRIVNLKKVICEFQRILFRILNNFSESVDPENELEYFSNKLNIFIDKHRKKLSGVKITNDKNEHMVFKHWKGVVRGFYADSYKDGKLNLNLDEQKIINAEILNKIDTNGNMILFYIVDELTKLIKYNQDKIMRVSVSYFILGFINTIFDLFNTERLINNIDLKRFEYMISSVTYIQEITEKSGLKETEGIYSEYVDHDEEISPEERERLDDAIEEDDALDYEVDEDQQEGAYDRYIDEWEPSREITYNPLMQ